MHASIPSNYRIDDLELADLRIVQDPVGFCFGMDAVLLAHFARAKPHHRILDLGTGNGILPLLLFGLYKPAHIVGIEIQQKLIDMAQCSVRLNGLEQHVRLVAGDYRDAALMHSLGAFDLIVSNPPYHPVGSGDMSHDLSACIARFELTSTLGDVMDAAAVLKDGGRFCMVYLPKRLPEVFSRMHSHRLTPKRIVFVHPRAHSNASLVLIEARKNASAGLSVGAPLIVHERDGSFTRHMEEIYQGGRLL